ncbi:hypothetical protein Dsin_001355 [Dipteronia sinensis]|uniref:Reverse transcriptase zinc-binding domain-containing protein n=1 Tax=Dipteronia sinensis TaxID=43782 RepID=A0AAE0B5F9_9ROSI|nr:hypothetical protein Dsin_001355 [Dipteronia sinensis]
MSSLKSFNEFIVKAKVLDILMQGLNFTWSNNKEKSLWVKLDRFSLSPTMLSWYPKLSQQCLHRNISDHSVVAICEPKLDWGSTPFRFFNHWMEDKEMIADAIKGWNEFEIRKMIPDTVAWSFCPNGMFSVQSFCKCLDSDGRDNHLNSSLIWNNYFPHKVEIFVWNLLKERVLVKEALVQFMMDLSSNMSCPLYVWESRNFRLFKDMAVSIVNALDLVKFRVGWWYKHHEHGSVEPISSILLNIRDLYVDKRKYKPHQKGVWFPFCVNRALELCVTKSDLMGRDIVIISDSKMAVSWVNNRDDFRSLKHIDLIYDIKGFIKVLGGISVVFNQRHTNSFADNLAKMGSSRIEVGREWGDLRPGLLFCSCEVSCV